MPSGILNRQLTAGSSEFPEGSGGNAASFSCRQKKTSGNKYDRQKKTAGANHGRPKKTAGDTCSRQKKTAGAHHGRQTSDNSVVLEKTAGQLAWRAEEDSRMASRAGRTRQQVTQNSEEGDKMKGRRRQQASQHGS